MQGFVGFKLPTHELSYLLLFLVSEKKGGSLGGSVSVALAGPSATLA